MKVSILCPNLANNALGRAYLLGELLGPGYEVEIIGPLMGSRIWHPCEAARLPIKDVGGLRMPSSLLTLKRYLRMADGDIIYVSKPLSTNFGIALLKKKFSGRPLVLDIDDWEMRMVRSDVSWLSLEVAKELANFGRTLYSNRWISLMDSLAKKADAVTVSNNFLRERYGGSVIVHARDTGALDPGKFDRDAARRKLGIGTEKCIMFCGTLWPHKGVGDLVRAAGMLKRSDARLFIAGATRETAQKRLGMEIDDSVAFLGEYTFAELPHYLAAADIVAVPQRDEPESAGQLPAKLFDAMAMAKPIISTRMCDIPEILSGCGVLIAPGDVNALAKSIERLLDDEGLRVELGRKARERCVQMYSVEVVGRKLRELFKAWRKKWGMW